MVNWSSCMVIARMVRIRVMVSLGWDRGVSLRWVNDDAELVIVYGYRTDGGTRDIASRRWRRIAELG